MPGFLGQGRVLVGNRLSSGLPDVMRWIGNASKFELNLTEDTVERNESFSGNRLPFRRATRARKGTLSIVFDEFSKDNMALALLGATTAVTAGSAVTNYALASPPVVGSTLALPAKNVSAVVIKDSTGSPKTLTLGVNYTLDAFAGTIDILDLTTGGAYVMPLKADYTPGAVNVIGAFKIASPELYLRMDGTNTDDGSRCIIDVFRNRLSPTKNFDPISDDFVDFGLDGTVLADATRTTASTSGQFFSLTTP